MEDVPKKSHLRMSVADRRRITGPANARPIQFMVPDGPKTVPAVQTHSKDESLFIENGLVSNSNGSSYLEVRNMGGPERHTLLLSSVYGPRPTRGSFNSKASLTIQFKEVTLENFSSGQVKELCNFLTNVFNGVINLGQYPKSGIDIFLNLIQHEGTSEEFDLEAIIPACINGITLALVDAGVEIYDMVSAGAYKGTVVSFIKNGEEIVGFWKDNESAETDDLMEVIDKCKEHYLKNHASMIQYLIKSKSKK